MNLCALRKLVENTKISLHPEGFFHIFASVAYIIASMAKKKSKLRLLRIVLAAITLTAFVLLFLDIAGIFHGILGFLPKMQFWPAVMAEDILIFLMWVVISALFGRVYCAVACPMGIIQDLLYRLRITGKKKKRFKQKYVPERKWARYGILALFVAGVVLGGTSIACLIEPYSDFGLIMSSFALRSLTITLMAAGIFVVILVFVFFTGRGWCNTVCPVGTLLGIASRHAFFTPVIDDDKCEGCGLCGKACRAQCIDTVNHKIDSSRCVMCMDCLENCNSNAISFKRNIRKTAVAQDGANAQRDAETRRDDGEGRRAFLIGSALALGSVAAKADENHGGLLTLDKKQSPRRNVAIVPPGAFSLKNFHSKCVGCQLCVQACPSKVLRPSLDPDHFIQPVMDFTEGFCRPECTACSQVCPTGAIVKIEPERKSAISIGRAVYDPWSCVVVTDAVKCGNCARHCPAGAISMVAQSGDNVYGYDESLRIPSVNTERCIGCGRCEYVCPSRPHSAIYVEGNEVHREI